MKTLADTLPMTGQSEPRPTGHEMQSSKASGTPALTLRDNGEAKIVVAKEIHERFNAMKTYGKEPESLGSITRVMLNDLADFPPEKIIAAFRTHAQRSAEFPTTYDLIGLIRRNGRPPLRESDVIAIRRKAGEDRTPDEWATLRRWDDEQRDGWDVPPDSAKAAGDSDEIRRLRQNNLTLKAEVKRLGDLLHEARQMKGLEKPSIPMQKKVQNTIRAMRQQGAAETDIEAFASANGMDAAEVV
jgi:hypothetical protein